MILNGRLSPTMLGTIPGLSVKCRIDLLVQVIALRAAFEHEFKKPLTITDGYRPYEVQERIFRQRYVPTWLPGRPRKWWNGQWWYQKPGTAMAATPGTSNHGLGVAFDFGSMVNRRGTPEHNWMVAHAPLFGFRWPQEWARAAGEWWHFDGGHVVPVDNYVRIPGAVPRVPDLELPDDLEVEMTPEQEKRLHDRLDQVVAHFEQRVNDLAGYVDRRINQLAGWNRDQAEVTRDALAGLPHAVWDYRNPSEGHPRPDVPMRDEVSHTKTKATEIQEVAREVRALLPQPLDQHTRPEASEEQA